MIRKGLAQFKKVTALAVAGVAGVALLATIGCGGEDRPGSVSIDPESETVSVSGTGSGTASGLGASAALGGYKPVSDVSTHAKVSFDVAYINGLLGEDEIDFGAIREVYEKGMHSVEGVGQFRTLAGFANSPNRSEPVWDDYTAYYGDPTWLHTFVVDAIQGTGAFEGEPPLVRRQAVQKGIQNGIMIAWTVHEMVEALEEAEEEDLEPASGAPHKWDEAVAFYLGLAPAGAPFATANKRGENFGKGTEVNDAIMEAFIHGQEELLEGEIEEVEEDFEKILAHIKVTYAQAAIRYASKMADAVEAGEMEEARIEQAEGWSFYRVIEPLVAEADPDVARKVAGYFDLASQPSAEAKSVVPEALASVYEKLGIAAEQVGELQS